MILRSKWMVPAVLGFLLLGCDSGSGPPADVRDVAGPAAADDAAPANEASKPAESIIREDVLAETENPPEPKVKPVEVTLRFADADGELPAPAAERLDALLAEPVMALGGCIIVRGHTDSRGSDEQNLLVSERRARLVGDYLVEKGVEPERLQLIALGERRPIAPNATPLGRDFPEGRARNRRVTVEVQLPDVERQGPCETANPEAEAQTAEQ